MTRIGYVKPQMFSTTYEALTQPPNFGFRLRPLSSSRLRSTARFCIPLHRLGAGAFLGLVPFSAIIVRRAEQASTPVASRPQVFATSRQDRRPQRLAGLFHPAGTPRVSVCRGHDLIDRVLFPVPGSCAVFCSSWVPSGGGGGSRPLAVAPLRGWRPRLTRPLAVLQRLAPILNLDRPWSVAPEQACLISSKGFTPPTRARLS